MSLEASGTGSGETVEIVARRSGMPETNGGSFVWKNSGDTLYRGWDVPTVITGWEAVVWTDGSGGNVVKSTSTPHAVTLSDGTVVCVVQRRYVPIATNYYQVCAYVRDPSDGTWSASVVYSSTTTSPTYGYHPCLILLPSGRLLCYYLAVAAVADTLQIGMAYSDDSGATWTTGSDGVLKTPIDVSGSSGSGAAGGDPARIRGAYMNGQVLLVVEYVLHDTDPSFINSFLQYASDDLGCRFSQIGDPWDGETTIGGEESGRYHEVIALGGQFQLYWINGARSGRPCVRRVGNAYDRLADNDVVVAIDKGLWEVESGGFTGAHIDDGDLAMCVDDDGTAYLLGRAADDINECVIARSVDAGETWELLGSSDYTMSGDPVAKWWDGDDGATYPVGFCATPQGGRLAVLHNWVATPGNEDDSLGCIYLGGYSTVTMPATASPATDLTQVSWMLTGLPFDLPSDTVWSATGAGTAALSNGHLGITTSSNTLYYEYTPTSSETEGLIVRFSLRIDDVVGSLSSNEIAVSLRLADGTNDRQVDIRFLFDGTDHELRARDLNASANIGSDVIIDGDGGVDIIAAIRGSNFTLYYRPRSNQPDRAYSVGPSTTSLTNDTGSPSANNLVRFGHIASSSADSSWFEWHLCFDEYTGSDLGTLAEGQDNPDDLFARTFAPTPTWVDGGLRVKAVDGPVMAGESWSISPKYDYDIRRIFPSMSASPRVRWRSADTSQQTIALVFDTSLLGTVESSVLNTAIGLTAVGSNWRTGTWQGYDVDTAAWVTITAIDASTGLTGLDHVRQGNTIIPATGSASDEPYLHLGECKDWVFSYDGSTFRRVLTNTEGQFNRSTTVVKRPTLILSGVEAGDPSGGSNGYLIPTSFTVVVYTSAKYAGYRLVIDSQSTPEGYFEIGALMMGPVVVWGQGPDWQRSIETEAGTELSEARDRTTRSRVAAPPRRTVEVGWSDGMDLTGVESKTPDYVRATTTSGVNPAASIDTSYQIEGLLGLLDGAHQHVVYLPRLPQGPSDTVVLNRRSNHLFGRAVGNVRVETVLGDEGSDELVRLGSIPVREEV